MTIIDRRSGVTGDLAYKAPARVATTASIALTGLQTINGVALAAGDRVLVWQQADPKANGIYVASSGLWVRAQDLDGNNDFVGGTQVLAGGRNFRVTSRDPIVIGTSDINFQDYNSTVFRPSTDYATPADAVAAVGGTLFVPNGNTFSYVGLNYPSTLIDYLAPSPMGLASEGPQANEVAKRHFLSYFTGPRTTNTLSGFGVTVRDEGSRLNGPNQAGFAATFSIQKVGFGNAGTSQAGEIDGLRIGVRQAGPDSRGNPSIQSDANGVQIGLVTYGYTGNSAAFEAQTSAVSADGGTGTINLGVHTGLGAIGNTVNAIYGYSAQLTAPAVGTGNFIGALLLDGGGGVWDWTFLSQDQNPRSRIGINGIGQIVYWPFDAPGTDAKKFSTYASSAGTAGTWRLDNGAGSQLLAVDGGSGALAASNTISATGLILRGATSGVTTLGASAIAAGAIILPPNSTTLAGLALAQVFTAPQTISPTLGANLTLGGNTTPQVVLTPSGGATKSAQIYQQVDLFRIAALGVVDQLTLNLNSGQLVIAPGTAIPAGGTAGLGYSFSSTANFGMFFGSGAPTLAAAKGSLYLRSNGSAANDRAYINTDGATTWTALSTAA